MSERKKLKPDELLLKISLWLQRLATNADQQAAKSNQYLSLKAAYEADAKNYRAVVEEITECLS